MSLIFTSTNAFVNQDGENGGNGVLLCGLEFATLDILRNTDLILPDQTCTYFVKYQDMVISQSASSALRQFHYIISSITVAVIYTNTTLVLAVIFTIYHFLMFMSPLHLIIPFTYHSFPPVIYPFNLFKNVNRR